MVDFGSLQCDSKLSHRQPDDMQFELAASENRLSGF